VDFDHSLNTAVNKVREVLGDSALSPRFIETMAKRGYRFVASVSLRNAVETEGVGDSLMPGQAGATSQPGDRETPEPGEPETRKPEYREMEESGVSPTERAEGPAAPVPASPSPHPLQSPSQFWSLARPEQLPQASRATVRTLFLLLQVMYFSFYVISLARLHVVVLILNGAHWRGTLAVPILVLAAVLGVPARLFLFTAVWFRAPGFRQSFLRIFPALFVFDELWALAPFLLTPWIGFGLAFGATAALLYVPFAQRSLVLMGAGER
jgi:hypothetical protein